MTSDHFLYRGLYDEAPYLLATVSCDGLPNLRLIGESDLDNLLTDDLIFERKHILVSHILRVLEIGTFRRIQSHVSFFHASDRGIHR